MEKKTILITGVAGLLGSRLADWIIENKGDEYQVIGVDDLDLSKCNSTQQEVINQDIVFFSIILL